MHRFMVTAWVKDTPKALEFYKKAFGAKQVGEAAVAPDGTFYHVELDIFGQFFSLSEARNGEEKCASKIMVFGLHFKPGEEEKIQKIYDVLKEDAQIISPLGPCVYSQFEVDLIDKFGVRWVAWV